jgi:hypothetical protein
MTDQREPVYDPEAVGQPGTVDPDSRADDEAESGREADGPQTPVAPYDRPQAMDAFGTTAEEGRQGTPLDRRLSAELPDVTPVDAEAADQEAAAVEPDDAALADLDGGSVAEPVAGRLIQPADPGTSSMMGQDTGMAGGGASAEETAMHVVEEP